MKKYSLVNGSIWTLFAMLPLSIFHSSVVALFEDLKVGGFLFLFGIPLMLFFGLLLSFFISIPTYYFLARCGWASWAVVIAVGGVIGALADTTLNSNGNSNYTLLVSTILGMYFGVAFKYGAEKAY